MEGRPPLGHADERVGLSPAAVEGGYQCGALFRRWQDHPVVPRRRIRCRGSVCNAAYPRADDPDRCLLETNPPIFSLPPERKRRPRGTIENTHGSPHHLEQTMSSKTRRRFLEGSLLATAAVAAAAAPKLLVAEDTRAVAPTTGSPRPSSVAVSAASSTPANWPAWRTARSPTSAIPTATGRPKSPHSSSNRNVRPRRRSRT